MLASSVLPPSVADDGIDHIQVLGGIGAAVLYDTAALAQRFAHSSVR
jgi:hypothetical protein